MLLLSNSDDNGLYTSQKPLVALENATKKSSERAHIHSVTEQMLEQLNKKDKEIEKMERKMEKKEREMEKIRSEKEEMKNEMEKMRSELENCKKMPASPSPDESAKV